MFGNAIVNRQVDVFRVPQSVEVQLVESSLLMMCYEAVLKVEHMITMQVDGWNIKVHHFAVDGFRVDRVVLDVHHPHIRNHLNRLLRLIDCSIAMKIIIDNPQLVVHRNVMQFHRRSIRWDDFDDDELGNRENENAVHQRLSDVNQSVRAVDRNRLSECAASRVMVTNGFVRSRHKVAGPDLVHQLTQA